MIPASIAAMATNGLIDEPMLYWPWIARLTRIDLSGSSVSGNNDLYFSELIPDSCQRLSNVG